MESTELVPEPFRQPSEREHPVDPGCPSSSPDGWRPSDAPQSPHRIGAGEEAEPIEKSSHPRTEPPLQGL
jgi:hypothetical protein